MKYLFRFFSLIVRGIFRKELQEKAALLAYYTLITLIPVFAFFILLSKGLLLEETFIEFIKNSFPSQTGIITEFLKLAKTTIEITSKKAVIGITIFLFLWSVFKILSHLEAALNQIFEVRKERDIIRRVSNYLVIIFLFPLLLTLTTLSNFFITAHFSGIGEYFIVLQLFSFLTISFLFSFLYLFLPNTQVPFFPALFAGMIAALLYQLFQALYLFFQITFSHYHPLIGTLAGIPIFLIWLQLSWLILLLGARITVYFQDIHGYEFLYQKLKLSHYCKVVLSLEISYLCIKQFCNQGRAITIKEIAKYLKLSKRVVKMILFDLIDAKVLIEVKNPKEEVQYLPAHDVEQLTIKRVLDMINVNGDSIPLVHTEEIINRLEKFDRLIEKSKDNIALKNIK